MKTGSSWEVQSIGRSAGAPTIYGVGQQYIRIRLCGVHAMGRVVDFDALVVVGFVFDAGYQRPWIRLSKFQSLPCFSSKRFSGDRSASFRCASFRRGESTPYGSRRGFGAVEAPLLAEKRVSVHLYLPLMVLRRSSSGSPEVPGFYIWGPRPYKADFAIPKPTWLPFAAARAAPKPIWLPFPPSGLHRNPFGCQGSGALPCRWPACCVQSGWGAAPDPLAA